jgi:hypothetical protein
LLSKKTGQTGCQPGQGGAQIKPPTGTEDCESNKLIQMIAADFADVLIYFY